MVSGDAEGDDTVQRAQSTAGVRRCARLCAEQNYRCAYCGVVMVLTGPGISRNQDHSASTDEIIPRVAGGAVEWENQVAACRRCNSARGSLDALEWFASPEAGSRCGCTG